MKKSNILLAVAALLLVGSLPVIAKAAVDEQQVLENVKPTSASLNQEAASVVPDGVGWGTISCQDGNYSKMICPWSVSSPFSAIYYSGIEVVFSDYYFQNFYYDINTPGKRIGDVAENTVLEPGYYSAELAGYVITSARTETLIPVTSADVYID